MKYTPRIRQLPPGLCNRIAAGEVVDRPAGVVKELIENSLDAGANDIEIFLENGGQELIRVTDNGSGMMEEDLELAFSRHATSKISDFDDLWNIHTFGFRGEALPSIASVAQVRIESSSEFFRDDPEAMGAFLELSGGEIVQRGPCAYTKGTKIAIRDLFRNVPARLKFLKSASAEQKRITDIVARLAMAHEGISFRLVAGNRELLRFRAEDDVQARLREVWPPDVADALFPFSASGEGISVSGFTAPPEKPHVRSDRLWLYVNGRSVSDKLLQRAVREAYKGRLLAREYPQSILFMTLDPADVDVNVHPAKSEVRFRDENRVFSIVMHAIRQALDAHGFNDAGVSAEQNNAVDNVFYAQTNLLKPEKKAAESTPAGFWGAADGWSAKPEQKSVDAEEVSFVPDFCPPQRDLLGKKTEFREIPPESVKNAWTDQRKIQPICSENVCDAPAEDVASPLNQQQTFGSVIGPYRYLGQLGNSYLMLQDMRNDRENASFILLDQHAAHERVLVSQLQKRGVSGPAQALVLPLNFTLHRAELERLEELWDTLISLGFSLKMRDLGTAKGVTVTSIPGMLSRENAASFLKESLSGSVSDLNALWAGMACKSAIKAGDSLSEDEALNLIRQWLNAEDREYCPHGRPCVLSWSIADLDRLFKR